MQWQEKLFNRKFGLQILLLLGFRMNIEGWSDSSSNGTAAAATTTQQGSIIAVGDDSVGTIVASLAELDADINATSEPAKAVLVLNEPDPSDTMKWIEWFDNLTASKGEIAKVVV